PERTRHDALRRGLDRGGVVVKSASPWRGAPTGSYPHSFQANLVPRGNRIERRSKSMKIRPLQDRVIVRRVQEEEKTKGGIIIPDTAKEKPQEGKVVAVGKGKANEDGKVVPLDVKVNDRILFGKYSGSEVKLDGD